MCFILLDHQTTSKARNNPRKFLNTVCNVENTVCNIELSKELFNSHLTGVARRVAEGGWIQ